MGTMTIRKTRRGFGAGRAATLRRKTEAPTLDRMLPLGELRLCIYGTDYKNSISPTVHNCTLVEIRCTSPF